MSNNPETNNNTLIIIPGWGGSHETWADFVNSAKKDFTDIHVIDMPCFGGQDCPKEIWGVDEFAEYVKEEIYRITQRKFVLLGHSFGGQIAVKFADKYPENIEKLILSGAAVFRPKRIIRRLILGTIAKTGKMLFKLPIIEKLDILARKFFYKAVGSPDYNKTSGIKREIFKKIIRQDLEKLLPNINIPTLIIWGEKDLYTPLRYGKKINKLISNSKLHIIKNGGHGLHLHNKEEILSLIRRFINS